MCPYQSIDPLWKAGLKKRLKFKTSWTIFENAYLNTKTSVNIRLDSCIEGDCFSKRLVLGGETLSLLGGESSWWRNDRKFVEPLPRTHGLSFN